MSSAPGEMCKSEISAMNRGRGHQRPAFVEPLEEIRRHIAASSSIAAIRAPLTAETNGLPHSLCIIVLEFSNNPQIVFIYGIPILLPKWFGFVSFLILPFLF